MKYRELKNTSEQVYNKWTDRVMDLSKLCISQHARMEAILYDNAARILQAFLTRKSL